MAAPIPAPRRPAASTRKKRSCSNSATLLRDQLEKSGKYRVVMTRTDDTFIPLDERVRFARQRGPRSCSYRSMPTGCRAPRATRRARLDLYAVGNRLRRDRGAPCGGRKPRRRGRRGRPQPGAERRRRHPVRSGAARDQDLFAAIRQTAGRGDEAGGAAASASAEIGRVQGAAARRTCPRCWSSSAMCPTRPTSRRCCPTNGGTRRRAPSSRRWMPFSPRGLPARGRAKPQAVTRRPCPRRASV